MTPARSAACEAIHSGFSHEEAVDSGAVKGACDRVAALIEARDREHAGLFHFATGGGKYQEPLVVTVGQETRKVKSIDCQHGNLNCPDCLFLSTTRYVDAQEALRASLREPSEACIQWVIKDTGWSEYEAADFLHNVLLRQLGDGHEPGL